MEARPRPSRDWATRRTALALPQILPGGKAILFAAVNGATTWIRSTIEVLTLADRHRKIVVRGGTSPRYLATSSGAGHLVYVNKAHAVRRPVRSGHAGDARDGRARAGRCRLCVRIRRDRSI